MADRYREFREFAAGRASALSRVAFLLTGDDAKAAELLEAVLAKAAAQWPRLAQEGDPEAFVRHGLYSHLLPRWSFRSGADQVLTGHVTPTGPPPATPPGPPPERVDLEPGDAPGESDEHADVVRRRHELARALDTLTPRQRAVTVLRFYEDFTDAEAGRVLGCSTATVRSEASHALTRIHEAAPGLFADPADAAANSGHGHEVAQ